MASYEHKLIMTLEEQEKEMKFKRQRWLNLNTKTSD